MTEFKYKVGDRVEKFGGSYSAKGVIKAVFEADDGSPRYVFRFDSPAGLLHIFNEGQLEEKRCEYCDGTGDVHDQIGEWRGICICKAGWGGGGTPPEVATSPLSVESLRAADAWGEHPEFSRQTWVEEVIDFNVQSGYWEWVLAQIETE